MPISMDTTLALVVVAAVASAGVWQGQRTLRQYWAERRRMHALRRIQKRICKREQSSHTDFRAVSIVPARPACKLARRYQDIRYLGSDAPRLPLAGCRIVNCRCRYEHHADRRSEDRRNPFGIDHVPIGIEHNRRGGDRRRTPGAMPAASYSF